MSTFLVAAMHSGPFQLQSRHWCVCHTHDGILPVCTVEALYSEVLTTKPKDCH